MPVLNRWRDSFPLDNPDGDGHLSGSECACVPWCFYDDDRRIVVVHGDFTEKIIYTQAPEAYDDAVSTEVEWEIQA